MQSAPTPPTKTTSLSAWESTRASVALIGLDAEFNAVKDGRLDFSRVIFIDIDGVLHSENAGPEEAFACAVHLETSLHAADPQGLTPLVICSDWRLSTSLASLRGRLPASLARRLVGVTPDLLAQGGHRGAEAKAWMALHAPLGQWLAIDDRPNWYGADSLRVFAVPSRLEGGPGCLDERLALALTGRLNAFFASRPAYFFDRQDAQDTCENDADADADASTDIEMEIPMDPRFIPGEPLVEFDPNLPAGYLNFDKVLFLDIDGVLHPEPSDTDMHMCFSGNFCEVIQAVDPQGEMPIVISSAWRFDSTLEKLRKIFSPAVARQIVGVTPDFRDKEKPMGGWTSTGGYHQGGRRQRECEQWMATYCPAGQWLAIDDREDGFNLDCQHLFLVPGVYEENGGGINTTMAIDLQERLLAFLDKPASAPVIRPMTP